MAYWVKIKVRVPDAEKTAQRRKFIVSEIKRFGGRDASGAMPGKYVVGVFNHKTSATGFRTAARSDLRLIGK
jgi:hypothetical protein